MYTGQGGKAGALHRARGVGVRKEEAQGEKGKKEARPSKKTTNPREKAQARVARRRRRRGATSAEQLGY